jgi:phosphopantetheine adenylyltransferase
MPNEQFFFTSSNLLKQVFKFTDRERRLIPNNVHKALSEKFGHNLKAEIL